MYAAVTVKSETGTTVKYFTKLTEAFEFAAKNENKGCTRKCSEISSIEILTLT